MGERKITIALAGNANVGKSVIFNHLTGLHQHIGNWPGKTIERAEGTLYFEGYTIDVIDLPGIYSLSTFSMEELISRNYIVIEKPDIVINVVDASVLERNLFFTIQLLELEVPMVMALNQMDMARKKGISINFKKLQKILGIPVIPTIAPKGLGIHQLLKTSIKTIKKKKKIKPIKIEYGKEIEERIKKLTSLLKKVNINYPARYAAIKLLEGDKEIKNVISKTDKKIISVAERYAREIERIHGHSCPTVISSERYNLASKITKEVQKIVAPNHVPIGKKLDDITTHRILGYPIMVVLLISIFFTIFKFGDFFSSFLSDIFLGWFPTFEKIFGYGIASKLTWSIVEGMIAGVTIVLPYIAPFYLILGFLEDSGYLSRVAFLMDNIMHKIGLHGKAFIPLMLGYGCNVPACLGCRIMETERERLIAIFVITLVPCAAVTVIILGLVGSYIGLHAALALYLFNLIIIFVLGRIAFKALPGEPTGLIMEMHDYRMPHLKTVVKQTWFRIKDYILCAFPLIIIGSFLIKVLEVIGLLEFVGNLMSPIIVNWLGLPVIAGITLIFGILRKELTLVMLATLAGTTNFALVLTPIQMIVFALVTMLYIPCIATIAALVREIGWKKAFYITILEIVFATFVGGLVFRILS
jgi:ferrous iron transport protein B